MRILDFHHVGKLYTLGKKRFRSPADYMALMQYLSDDFAKRVIQPKEYEGGKVLDAGCSYGGYIDAFYRGGASVVIGVDMSRERLAEGKVRYAVQADVTETPFPSGTFDLVYSRGVIEHVPDQAAFVRECFRIARQGGYVCITAPPW